MNVPKPPRQSRRERRQQERPERRQKHDEATKLHRQAQKLLRQNASAPAFWHGEPCTATRLKVLLAGLEVPAVRVNFGDGMIYLDDTNGAGWLKVTAGRGSKSLLHRELNLESLEEIV
ncbi:hypothetical protein [Armatimonas sp.]|uniref:hypothetical protein n=1 Tax=Armatimonas sp. TaxID=1872638 RepID=UPI00375161E4